MYSLLRKFQVVVTISVRIRSCRNTAQNEILITILMVVFRIAATSGTKKISSNLRDGTVFYLIHLVINSVWLSALVLVAFWRH